MNVYENNPGKWIFAYLESSNLTTLYNDSYLEEKPKNYYDPTVLKIRENFVKTNCNISKSFDYGCGRNPFHIKNGISECIGMWDRYAKEFNIFNRETYFNSETLLLFDVLEHFHDPLSFLTTLHHNKVIMTVPVFPKNLTKIEDVFGWKHYRPEQHFCYFTKEGIIELCEQAQWNVVYYGYDECKQCGGPREDIASIILTR